MPTIHYIIYGPAYHVPPVIREQIKNKAIRNYIVFGVAIIVIVSNTFPSIESWMFFLFFVLYSLTFRRIDKKGMIKFRKEVYLYDFLVCSNCGYCLKGLQEDYRCPECGETYTASHLKETWSRYYLEDNK